MDKIHVLSIIGTRPEAVKMAPVVRALAAEPRVRSTVLATAQHRELLDQVLGLFNITPDHDLDLMRPDQAPAELAARILDALDPLLAELRPDWVLVQGDTTTVVAAVLAAYYRRVHIGHVEAGLRTHDRWQPFPEELNRRVASVLADLHFAPTEHARANLLAEGIPSEAVALTGNPVIDALQAIVGRPAPAQALDLLRQMGVEPGGRQLVLVTAHRRENFGRPIEDICDALAWLAQHFHNRLHILYPVHPNPNIHEPVQRLLGGMEGITLTPPLGYLSMVHLLDRSRLVLTDSGGIQEEATALGRPALVLRNVTERPEGVKAGILQLVGTRTETITAAAARLLEDETAWQAAASGSNPYGDGHAAEKIVAALLAFPRALPGEGA